VFLVALNQQITPLLKNTHTHTYTHTLTDPNAKITLEQEQLITALSDGAKAKELDAKRFNQARGRKGSLPADVLGVASMRRRRENRDGQKIDIKSLTNSRTRPKTGGARPRTGKRKPSDPITKAEPVIGSWLAEAMEGDRPRTGKKSSGKKSGKKSRRNSLADLQSMSNKTRIFNRAERSVGKKGGEPGGNPPTLLLQRMESLPREHTAGSERKSRRNSLTKTQEGGDSLAAKTQEGGDSLAAKTQEGGWVPIGIGEFATP
jgi:hypothetical protein